MDYQFVCTVQIVLLMVAISLNTVQGIVGRDLVLTPKQGLQLHGKSLYYKEDTFANTHNQSSAARPWERTLKHVTYVTIFSKVDTDGVARNISNLQTYSDFLQAPYITQHNENDVRFGDIVTLAHGRLERTLSNNSFRFVEGSCNLDCDAQRVVAVWQVQKIRHRDTKRKFRYEMKFSVSPIQTDNGGNIKRTADLSGNGNNSGRRNAFQTFIQRDDDYPQTFGKIIYADQTAFADRRFDDYTGRNFRQIPLNDYRQVTPMPQSTFLHGIFQPHPHYPPTPEKLNIGEYIKDYGAKATPKIELFPNILNPISRNNYITPTTFRPNYQIQKLPRPDLYHSAPPQQNPLQHAPMKFPTYSQEYFPATDVGKITPPVVTHHFHHHFYMPSTTSIENSFNSAEQLSNHTENGYKNDIAEMSSGYFSKYYSNPTHYSQVENPTQSDVHFPNTETEVHREHVVQVTPVPPLKKPQLYHMYPIGVSARVPLLIYPAPVVEEQSTDQNKPFIQSEPIDIEPIRYSEPDPLYLSLAHNPSTSDVHQYELNAPQLEAPKVTHYDKPHYNTFARSKTKPNSISAQLPPPDKDQDVRIPYVDEDQESSNKSGHDLEQTPSQKDVHVSTENPVSTTPTQSGATTAIANITNVAASTTPQSALTSTTKAPQSQMETIKASATSARTTLTPTTYILHSATTAETTTEAMDSTTRVTYSKNNFISSSTSVTPLHHISRYRSKYVRASTTTEAPVLKWKPRRKNVFNSVANGNRTKVIQQKKENITGYSVNNDSAAHTENEIFEVLTQKSVSKSVSVKVGNDGTEIPIIIDDTNEVKSSE